MNINEEKNKNNYSINSSIKKSKYNDSTNYLFVLTDALYQEKDYPKINIR